MSLRWKIKPWLGSWTHTVLHTHLTSIMKWHWYKILIFYIILSALNWLSSWSSAYLDHKLSVTVSEAGFVVFLIVQRIICNINLDGRISVWFISSCCLKDVKDKHKHTDMYSKGQWCSINPQNLEVEHRPTAQSVRQMKYAVLWHQWGKSNSDLRRRATPFNPLKHHSAGSAVYRG